MNISFRSTPRVAKRWERPIYEMPMPVSLGQLRPLGSDRGGTRHWYSHPHLGELAERGQLIDERLQGLPNGPLVEHEPGMWQPFDVYAPGTFALQGTTPVRKPKPAKPMRPISIVALWVAELAEAGPQEILAWAKRKGGTAVEVDADHRLAASSLGGRVHPAVDKVIDSQRDLLAAYCEGAPLTCSSKKHTGKRPVARQQILGGAPRCIDCLRAAS